MANGQLLDAPLEGDREQMFLLDIHGQVHECCYIDVSVKRHDEISSVDAAVAVNGGNGGHPIEYLGPFKAVSKAVSKAASGVP